MASLSILFFFFQAEDGIRDYKVTGVQTCALPICAVPVDLLRPAAQHAGLRRHPVARRHLEARDLSSVAPAPGRCPDRTVAVTGEQGTSPRRFSGIRSDPWIGTKISSAASTRTARTSRRP